MRSPQPANRRPTLLWQLFAAGALVLVAAVLALILTPVQVSEGVVLTEVLSLAGLAVMLVVHLLLASSHAWPRCASSRVMGTIDAPAPRARLPARRRAPPRCALAEAFNEMLDRLEAERRDSARRALAAQEDERLRIARELHDQIGQSLTALTLAARARAEADGPVDRELLERLAQAARESLEDVRRIARELRPEALDDLGLGNALIALCRRVGTPERRCASTAQLEPGAARAAARGGAGRLPGRAGGVTNALRHARAPRIDVDAARDRVRRVELIVARRRPRAAGRRPSDTRGHQRDARAGAARRRAARRIEPARRAGRECACPCRSMGRRPVTPR